MIEAVENLVESSVSRMLRLTFPGPVWRAGATDKGVYLASKSLVSRNVLPYDDGRERKDRRVTDKNRGYFVIRLYHQ